MAQKSKVKTNCWLFTCCTAFQRYPSLIVKRGPQTAKSVSHSNTTGVMSIIKKVSNSMSKSSPGRMQSMTDLQRYSFNGKRIHVVSLPFIQQ
jgi:hypothetical protein